MTLSRRSLITGLVSLVASPAIVRVSSLMPVKAWAADLSALEVQALRNRWDALSDLLINPPIGIDWLRQEQAWAAEHRAIGDKLHTYHLNVTVPERNERFHQAYLQYRRATAPSPPAPSRS